jgi:hypothetical protein
MNVTLSEYELATGRFTGVVVSIPARAAEKVEHKDSKLEYVIGRFDHLSQRVDIDTQTIVDYQPPQPSTEHEWNAATKRWQLTIEAEAIDIADAQARAEIQDLETRSLRAIREVILSPKDQDAIMRLDGLERQIADQRAKLKR